MLAILFEKKVVNNFYSIELSKNDFSKTFGEGTRKKSVRSINTNYKSKRAMKTNFTNY